MESGDRTRARVLIPPTPNPDGATIDQIFSTPGSPTLSLSATLGSLFSSPFSFTSKYQLMMNKLMCRCILLVSSITDGGIILPLSIRSEIVRK